MFHVEKQKAVKKKYELLLKQIDALTEGEPDMIANTANASALCINHWKTSTGRAFILPKTVSLCSGRSRDFLHA